jgi:hypothetical protein
LLCGLFVWAEEPAISKNPGHPIRATWSDGRSAVLMQEIIPTEPFRVTMKMNKSTCANTPPASCYVLNPLTYRKLFYVWEKNPAQPERERRTVESILEDGSREARGAYSLVTQDVQLTWRQLGYHNSIGAPLNMTIHCDRFDWLPADQAGATLESVFSPAWITNFEDPVGEFNIRGIEDNSAINQFTSAGKGVSLAAAGPGIYRVEDMEMFNTTVLNHGTILRGYITSFFFDRDQYDTHTQRIPASEEYPDPGCEVEFGLNFSEFFAQNNSKRKLKPTVDYDPLLAKPVMYDANDPDIHLESWMLEISGSVE